MSFLGWWSFSGGLKRSWGGLVFVALWAGFKRGANFLHIKLTNVTSKSNGSWIRVAAVDFAPRWIALLSHVLSSSRRCASARLHVAWSAPLWGRLHHRPGNRFDSTFVSVLRTGAGGGVNRRRACRDRSSSSDRGLGNKGGSVEVEAESVPDGESLI